MRRAEVNTEAVDNFYSPYRLYQTMNQKRFEIILNHFIVQMIFDFQIIDIDDFLFEDQPNKWWSWFWLFWF